jgi:hypothetical protein
MARRVRWQVVLRATLLWAACGPLLVVTLCSVSAALSGHPRVAPGSLALVALWPIFAPGAAVAGALAGLLLLWASRRLHSLTALRLRGLLWGAGLGPHGFLLGLLLLVVLTQGEGPEQSWGDLGWGLITVPAERPEVVGVYVAVALSGAILGWILAGWAAPVNYA